MRPVLVAAALFAIGWAYLAIARHLAFQSNAFDLGYVTQTLWYTAHGQPFRFTTLEGVPFSPEGSLNPATLHQPESLLAFHVEPLLLAIAPIFALWPDPRLLLILQAGALAAGSLGAAALARLRLKSEAAGVVFGLAFLLSPSVAAAAMSDFHAIAIGTALLMAAFFFLAAERRRLAFATVILTAAAREDAAIVVAMLGVYLAVRGLLARRRPKDSDALDRYGRAGVIILLATGFWVLLVFLAITPFFNGTIHALRHGEPGPGSIFWHRYAWLGPTPILALRNVILQPGLWLGWLSQRDVLAYIATLLISGGALAICAPAALAIALPVVLENALSSFDWMRSGGAHYSTILIPVFVFAGIEGTRWLLRFGAYPADAPISRLPSSRTRYLSPVLAFVLLAAVVNHAWLGASPLVPGLVWPTPEPRAAAVETALATIPPSASVSATSAVYPHIASRAQAYWYPAIQNADYIAVDAGSSADPLAPSELRDGVASLLAQHAYGVAASAPGLVVLQRNSSNGEIPADFYQFALARNGELAGAVRSPSLSFGSGLQLVGYQVSQEPTITIFGPSLLLTTYWQADRPLSDDLSFVFYPTRRSDGAIVGAVRDQAPEPVWYPTSRWQVGQTIRLTITFPRVAELQAVGVAVIDPATGQRLAIHAGSGAVLWENGTIARVARVDGGH